MNLKHVLSQIEANGRDRRQPSKTKCIAINGSLLNLFKSDDYTCDLKPIASTASGQSAMDCTKKDKTAQLLIFATRKKCEKERRAQAANGN